MIENEIGAAVQERVNNELAKYRRVLCWSLLAFSSVLLLSQFLFLTFWFPRFEEMFKQMDFGELPSSTKLLVLVAHFALPLYGGILVIALICHFKRLWVGLIVLIAILILTHFFVAYALFTPLFETIDRLNGK